MLLQKPVLALAAVVVLTPIGACAPSVGTSGAGATEAGESMPSRVKLRVVGDLDPSASVFAAPETGSWLRVGNTDPIRTATVHFNPLGAEFRYRFMAKTTGGAEIVSRPVSVQAGETVAWELRDNVVRVVDPG